MNYCVLLQISWEWNSQILEGTLLYSFELSSSDWVCDIVYSINCKPSSLYSLFVERGGQNYMLFTDRVSQNKLPWLFHSYNLQSGAFKKSHLISPDTELESLLNKIQHITEELTQRPTENLSFSAIWFSYLHWRCHAICSFYILSTIIIHFMWS